MIGKVIIVRCYNNRGLHADDNATAHDDAKLKGCEIKANLSWIGDGDKRRNTIAIGETTIDCKAKHT